MGFAFEDHAELVSAEGSVRMSLSSPERALLAFRRRDEDIDARIVWHDPAMATGVDGEEEAGEDGEDVPMEDRACGFPGPE